ncbi:MAG TPA: glycerol-3-phosphate 1-O-acyltransferase PlsY [Pyrinomonadaceae bacterium]|nr:glycerol-3-phosphate 1-O-acyltransferase PlsY [Pyrinomonadaceae bacterium]
MIPTLVIVGAYLLGSIPFGYLIVRARSGADIRDIGSGGTGATNVSRRAGKAAGIATLLLDAGKGAAAIAFAIWVQGSYDGVNWIVAAAALSVVSGHCFPIWLGFRGGKGVATGVGVFVVLAPVALALVAVVFVSIVFWTRYVSFGSISAAAALPLFICLQNALIKPVPGVRPVMFSAIGAAALVIFMHRANIARLIAGAENKFR